MTRKTKPPIALYSALADATRCRIVEILLAGPIPVHALADAFTISRPAISRHLRVLKTAGLVAEVKKGRENLYALRAAKLGNATDWIETILKPVTPGASRPADVEPLPVGNIAMTKKAKTRPERVERTRTKEAPTVAAGALVQAADPVPTARAEKLLRPAKPEPAVNQMGFDF